MDKTLIIPDVHGRDFWKEEVYNTINNEKNTQIIFLGDYVDPYRYELIHETESILTLEELIDLKKRYPKQITLLLGNHDCGYIWKTICAARRSYEYYYDISNLFTSNFELFDLAYQKDGILFTHAGVHRQWFELVHGNEYDVNSIAHYLNKWLHVGDNDLEYYLGIYTNFRGYSSDKFGSCIWADVREWLNPEDVRPTKEWGLYQIFGHTQLELEPIVGNQFACIDVRRPFILENNKLIDPYHPTGEWTYDIMKEQ